MQVAAFNPFIATDNVEKTIKLFEELGFEHSHTKEGIVIENRNDTVIRMQDSNGFCLDILTSNVKTPRDTVGIRINVDNFDDAYKTLLERGFKNVYGGEIVDSETSKAAMMVSPSGFTICIVQHIAG